MKKQIGIALLLLMITSTVFSQSRRNRKASEETEKPQTFVLQNEIDSLSYAIGVSIAGNIKQNFDTLHPEAIGAAFVDVYSKDKEVLMTAEQANEYVNAYFMKHVAREADDNLKKAEAFLAENKNKKGVITTESGLQYMVMEAGTGKQPSASSRVDVHYRGTLINGKEFDSSYRRGESAKFGVTQVIPGWTEALQLMKEGAKYKLFIHPDLAYGDRAPESIGPNQALIFEVELLEVLE